MKLTYNRTLPLDFFHPIVFLKIPDFILPLGIGFPQPDTNITLCQILSE